MGTIKNNKIIVETARVEYENFYILIVPDIASGSKGRYTVYKIPSSPSRRIKVIGRELNLTFAKKLSKEVKCGHKLKAY